MTTLFEVGQKVKFNPKKSGGSLLRTYYGDGPFEIMGIEDADKKKDIPSNLGSICDCGDCEPVDHPQILLIEINHLTHRLSGAHFVLAEQRRGRMNGAGKKEYNVVFEYTEGAGGYVGGRFWTSYSSKKKFDNDSPPEKRVNVRVVAEGISQERAIELVQQTPPECYENAAFEEAREILGAIEETEEEGDNASLKRIVKLTLTCPHCQKDKEIKVDMNDPDSALFINYGRVNCDCGQTYKIEGNINYSRSEL